MDSKQVDANVVALKARLFELREEQEALNKSLLINIGYRLCITDTEPRLKELEAQAEQRGYLKAMEEIKAKMKLEMDQQMKLEMDQQMNIVDD